MQSARPSTTATIVAFTGTLRGAEQCWRALRTQRLCVGGLLLLCTLLEIEKATGAFGLGIAGLLPGERLWTNHAMHLVSAALGWGLLRAVRYTPGDPPARRGAGPSSEPMPQESPPTGGEIPTPPL